MSSINSRKDTTSADLLNQIRQELLQKKAGRTASNNIVTTTIIPLNETATGTDAITQPTALGTVFRCTNDAGGGVTPSSEAGICNASCISEPSGGQIAAETADGYGAGVHQPGIIETTQCM